MSKKNNTIIVKNPETKPCSHDNVGAEVNKFEKVKSERPGFIVDNECIIIRTS